MAGIQNTIIFSQGERLQASNAQDIAEMQTEATDVSRINHTGDPEGVVSANPSSLSHDPVSGSIYQKQSGTGNTGWAEIGGSSGVDPFKTLTLVDDFIASFNGADTTPAFTILGQLQWDTFGGQWEAAVGTAAHPGLVSPVNGGVASISLDNNNNTNSIQPAAGQISLSFVMNLVALSAVANRYTINIGLGQSGGVTGNGISFQYADNVNSGNWQIKCTKQGVGTTTTNTSIAASTGYHKYQIVINAAGTSVEFFIDGVSAGTIATANIPSAAMSALVTFTRSSGALPAALLDLFVLQTTLTTTR